MSTERMILMDVFSANVSEEAGRRRFRSEDHRVWATNRDHSFSLVGENVTEIHAEDDGPAGRRSTGVLDLSKGGGTSWCES